MPTYSYQCEMPTCALNYEEVLKIAEYKRQTFCPKCGSKGKKTISLRSSEPTFTDKLYAGGFWDKSVNKVFHSQKERNDWMKQKGYVVKDDGHMTAKQERMMYSWRVGQFNPRDARYLNKD